MPPPYSEKTQTGCLVLFCAPFVICGVIALGAAVRMALLPSVNWLNVFGLVAFGLTFTLAGRAILQAQSKGRQKQIKLDRKRQLYPQSPWMWREDWAQGRVLSATRASMIQTWGFALAWNLISAPMLFLVPRHWETNRMALIALVFPLVGVVLLVTAVRQTIRWEEFGKTWFDIGTLPGVMGRELRGTINVHFPWPPQGGVLMKLSCVNRIVSGSGKNQSTTEKILWRDEQTLPAEKMQSGPIGSAIPVNFQIPIDGVETNTEDARNSIIWVLEADARTPGVNYQDSFEVPVFRTKDTRQETSTREPTVSFSSVIAVVPTEKPLDSRIIVRAGESGGTEFDFSAARNIGMAFGTTIFFLLWTGVIWFMISIKTPLLFTAVFELFDVLMFMIVLFMWLGTSKVTVGSGAVRVHSGLLGIGPTREVPFSQIAGFTMPVGMQSGGRSGTPYYDIKMKLTDGKEVAVASGIRNKLEAEWLLAKMKAGIGMKS